MSDYDIKGKITEIEIPFCAFLTINGINYLVINDSWYSELSGGWDFEHCVTDSLREEVSKIQSKVEPMVIELNLRAAKEWLTQNT